MTNMPGEATGVRLDFRLNVLSLANFGVLLGIFVTAISTWYSLQNDVKGAVADIAEIKQQIVQSQVDRRAEIESLRAKDEVISDNIRSIQDRTNERLYSIDSKVQILQNSISRVEEGVKGIVKREEKIE